MSKFVDFVAAAVAQKDVIEKAVSPDGHWVDTKEMKAYDAKVDIMYRIKLLGEEIDLEEVKENENGTT